MGFQKYSLCIEGHIWYPLHLTCSPPCWKSKGDSYHLFLYLLLHVVLLHSLFFMFLRAGLFCCLFLNLIEKKKLEILIWAYFTLFWFWVGNLSREGMGKAMLVKILVYGKTQNTTTKKNTVHLFGCVRCISVWHYGLLPCRKVK